MRWLIGLGSDLWDILHSLTSCSCIAEVTVVFFCIPHVLIHWCILQSVELRVMHRFIWRWTTIFGLKDYMLFGGVIAHKSPRQWSPKAKPIENVQQGNMCICYFLLLCCFSLQNFVLRVLFLFFFLPKHCSSQHLLSENNNHNKIIQNKTNWHCSV